MIYIILYTAVDTNNILKISCTWLEDKSLFTYVAKK